MNLRWIALEERHLEFTRQWRNHEDSRRWFNDLRFIDENSQRAWFNSRMPNSQDFIFILEVNGSPVGQFAVYNINDKSAEVGRFLIAPEQRGRGYFDVGLRFLLTHCTDNLFLETVFLHVKSVNKRAIRAYERNRFIEVATSGDHVKMERSLI
jgi:diamine N-acetyltransferase